MSFDESKIKRDGDGQFASKGGASNAGSKGDTKGTESKPASKPSAPAQKQAPAKASAPADSPAALKDREWTAGEMQMQVMNNEPLYRKYEAETQKLAKGEITPDQLNFDNLVVEAFNTSKKSGFGGKYSNAAKADAIAYLKESAIEDADYETSKNMSAAEYAKKHAK